MKLSDRLEQAVSQQVGELPVGIDNFFDHLFGQRIKGSHVPRTDLIETETRFELSMELPGLSVDDVAVEVSEDTLTISGEKRTLGVDETTTVRRRERLTGKFERSFQFSTQVDFEKIEAIAENGILTIIVPKSEKVLPRKIEIKVNG